MLVNKTAIVRTYNQDGSIDREWTVNIISETYWFYVISVNRESVWYRKFNGTCYTHRADVAGKMDITSIKDVAP